MTGTGGGGGERGGGGGGGGRGKQGGGGGGGVVGGGGVRCVWGRGMRRGGGCRGGGRSVAWGGGGAGGGVGGVGEARNKRTVLTLANWGAADHNGKNNSIGYKDLADRKVTNLALVTKGDRYRLRAPLNASDMRENYACH